MKCEVFSVFICNILLTRWLMKLKKKTADETENKKMTGEVNKTMDEVEN